MTTKTFFCTICDETISYESLVDDVREGIWVSMEHFRVLHPDVYAEIDKWPDGAPVVIDESIEPEDFGDESGDAKSAGPKEGER